MYDYSAIKKNVNDIYNQVIKSPNINDGLKIYFDFYSKVIKSYENYDHYEKCFDIINPIFERYLDKHLIFEENKFKFYNEDKINICFYLPNIANTLAHIEYLHTMLKEFDNKNYVLYIATNKNISESISNKVEDLLSRKIIKKIIQVNITSIEDIIKFSYEYRNFFNKFIVWALPLIIPLWTKIFSDRVIYVSLKFKYSSFSNLLNGIYFSTKKTKEIIQLKKTNWRHVETDLMDFNYDRHTKDLDKENVSLITVSRIEKIRNELFLDTVCEILEQTSSTKFYYTGKTDDPFVRNYFKINKLDNRVKFLGWVDPNKIINNYDIFLDAPYLSGTVAANFFISGMPVATFDETTSSYVDMNKNELYERFKMKFTFKTKREYVDYVIRLISDKKYFNKIRINQINSKDLFIKKDINLSQNFFRAINETNTI